VYCRPPGGATKKELQRARSSVIYFSCYSNLFMMRVKFCCFETVGLSTTIIKWEAASSFEEQNCQVLISDCSSKGFNRMNRRS